jgi:hypothetical protein
MGTQLDPIRCPSKIMFQGEKTFFSFFDLLTIKCPPNWALGTQLSGHSILSLGEKNFFFPNHWVGT